MRYTFIYNNVVENNIYFTEFARLFGSLLAVGVFAHIAIQVIINIAVVTNVFPNTGVTLPFISYGGSATILLLAELGIVFNISSQINLER